MLFFSIAFLSFKLPQDSSINFSACVDSIDSNMHSAASHSVAPQKIAQGELCLEAGFCQPEKCWKSAEKVLNSFVLFFNSTAVFFFYASNGFRSAWKTIGSSPTMRPCDQSLYYVGSMYGPKLRKLASPLTPQKKNTWPLTWRNEFE